MEFFRLSIKRFIGKICSIFPNNEERKIILLYHSVGQNPWATKLNNFKKQMEWLKENTYVTDIDSILDSNKKDLTSKKNKIQVAITFDDGYKSLVENVSPIVNELNMKPCVFLNTFFINHQSSIESDPIKGHYPNEEFMIWEDVKKLSNEGWSIGSHGCNHYDLTMVNKDIINYELQESKKIIEYNLGNKCKYFSYTFGKYNKTLISMVKNNEYEYGFTGMHKSLSKGFDKFIVPRINIEKLYSINDFDSIIKGYWDYHSWSIINLLKKIKNIFVLQIYKNSTIINKSKT